MEKVELKIDDLIIKEFHKSAYDFFNPKVLEMVEYGGRGSGKSSNMFMLAVVRIISEKTDCLVMRKVGNTLRTSVFTQVCWCIDQMGLTHKFKINKSTMDIIYKPWGNGFYFRGADDPVKIKSMKTKFPIGLTIFEEVDQFKEWQEVDTIKLSTLRGDIEHFKYIYMFNPPRAKHHWANKKWLFGNPDIAVHASDYRTNNKLPPQFFSEAEKCKRENENLYRWQYLGEAIGSAVIPFPKLIVNELDDELINVFDNIKQGVDWGFGGDAYSFCRCHYDERNETIYIFDEIYGHGLSNSYTANRIIEKGYHDTLTLCDSAEPKSINEYQDLGVNCYKTKKGPGSVEHGFRWLGDRTIIVDPVRCPNAARELQMADFKVDANGNLTSKIAGDDHFLDSLRYALEAETLRKVRTGREV